MREPVGMVRCVGPARRARAAAARREARPQHLGERTGAPGARGASRPPARARATPPGSRRARASSAAGQSAAPPRRGWRARSRCAPAGRAPRDPTAAPRGPSSRTPASIAALRRPPAGTCGSGFSSSTSSSSFTVWRALTACSRAFHSTVVRARELRGELLVQIARAPAARRAGCARRARCRRGRPRR